MVALGQPFSMDGFIVSLLTNNKSNSANNFALELHYVANSILNVFFENWDSWVAALPLPAPLVPHALLGVSNDDHYLV